MIHPPPTRGSVAWNRAEREVFALFEKLTGRLPWRLNLRPFPIIILEPADPDPADPDRLLEKLRWMADEMGLPAICPAVPDGSGSVQEQEPEQGQGSAALAGPGSSEERAIALLDTMSERPAWRAAGSQFGCYRFPRSDLIRSIQAAMAASAGSAGSPATAWTGGTGMPLWREGHVQLPRWWPSLGTPILGGIVAIATVIAQQTDRWALMAALAALLSVLVVLFGLTTRQIWLPIMSRLGVGSRYRWLATSSYFTVVGGVSFERRLNRVFQRLAESDHATFLLQLKTFAYLEDMRDNYRKLAPSLRGFKRSAPPVVFLKEITTGNGGIDLLMAMSDIRSRRSELHPLLIIASVDARHRGELPEPPGLPQPTGGTPKEAYRRWETALSIAQSPSRHVPLPWTLRLPMSAEPPGDDPPPRPRPRRRPRWTWLWSWVSLAVLTVIVAAAGIYTYKHLRLRYCEVGPALAWNPDTRLRTNADGESECVGVATGRVRFERGATSISLDGAQREPGRGHRGGTLTLRDLHGRIDAENDRVLESGADHVTVVYAGILTTSPGKELLSAGSLEELAGAHLAQLRNNRYSRLNVVLRLANAGQDMAFAEDLTDQILTMARQDRTVIGVVGLGRNTRRSQQAIRKLNRAGLAMINTTNSSDHNPRLPHYYSLAAADRQEAAALRKVLGKPVGRALIVLRDPGPSEDAYSTEIASDALQVIKPRHADHVVYMDGSDVAGNVESACEKAASPYDLVYFAGREEDLPGLLSGLTQGGCADRPLQLLAGDDITKARFGTGPRDVILPPSITVHYSAFVYLPSLVAGDQAGSSSFFADTRNVLGIDAASPAGHELLVDGYMALAYDATAALAKAAQNAYFYQRLGEQHPRKVPGSAAVSSGAVLLELRNLQLRRGATGDVDFRYDDHEQLPANRGLTLVKVELRDGRPVSTPVCGQFNGGATLPGLAACPR